LAFVTLAFMKIITFDQIFWKNLTCQKTFKKVYMFNFMLSLTFQSCNVSIKGIVHGHVVLNWYCMSFLKYRRYFKEFW